MATKDEGAPTPAAAPLADWSGLAAAITQGIAATAPARVIKEGDPEYTERLKAEGFYDVFEHMVLQNGYEAQPRGLSEEVRHRASHLKAGRYLKNRVTIEVAANGVVHIKYPNKDNDRIINRESWKDFPDLVNQIWTEMHAGALVG